MIPANKRHAIQVVVGAAVVAISTLIGSWVQSTSIGSFIEQRTYDLRFTFRGALAQTSETPITIIGIDEEALDHIPDPLMLWHGYFGKVINALADAQAAVVGLDFLFTDIQPFDPNGQQAFGQALLRAGDAHVPIVLGYRVKPNGIEEPPDAIKFAALAAGHDFAYLNLTTDNDDFVRRQVVAAEGENNEIRPGFAFALAKAYAGKKQLPFNPPPNDKQTLLINFRGPGYFDSVSFYRVLEAANAGDMEFLKSRFRDRIVLIGPFGQNGNEDLHSTPFYYSEIRSLTTARTPGIEIHANAIATLLEGDSIRQLSPTRQLLITLLLSALVSFLTFRFRPAVAFITGTVFVGAYLIVTFNQAFNERLWLFVVSPFLGAALAGGLSEVANYVLEGRDKQRLRKLFKSYVNDKVIEKILEVPDGLALEGERRKVTVLFADIRSFTTRSEGVSAEVLVADLNEYFKAMIQAIQKHNGMIDKFIGDGIMALFGVPLDDPDAALHAVEAAREMLIALNALNEQLSAQGRQPIHIGVGVHSGEAVVGNIGSPERMEYTAIGDVVNTASRIEGLTRKLDTDIVISEDTFKELAGRVGATALGAHELKGKSQPVAVYGVKL